MPSSEISDQFPPRRLKSSDDVFKPGIEDAGR